jgi:Holliday junction resolvase
LVEGDDKWARLLVECKTTEAKSIRVEARWLKKIAEEAVVMGCEPALSIEIQKSEEGVPRDWVMIPAELLSYLLGKEK